MTYCMEDITRIIDELNIIDNIIDDIRIKKEANIVKYPSSDWLWCVLWQRKRALEKIQMELMKPWSYNPTNTVELVYDDKGVLIEVNQISLGLDCEYTQ